jgi:RHS repeat-associated protein
MLLPDRRSFTARRRARLAVRLASLERLEPRNLITESLGIYMAGIGVGAAAHAMVARPAARETRLPPRAQALRAHHSNSTPLTIAAGSHHGGGGRSAHAGAEVAVAPAKLRQATGDWLTLHHLRPDKDSPPISLPSITTSQSSSAGGALPHSGGSGTSSSGITPLRLPPPSTNGPDSSSGALVAADPGTLNAASPILSAPRNPTTPGAPASAPAPFSSTSVSPNPSGIGTLSRATLAFPGATNSRSLLAPSDPLRGGVSPPTTGSNVALGEFTHFILYTEDMIDGVTMFPGFYQYATPPGGFDDPPSTMDLLAQVRSTAADTYTYSWNTTSLSDATSITGTSTPELKFHWTTPFFGSGQSTKTDSVTLTVTNSSSQQEIQTYTFIFIQNATTGSTTAPTFPQAVSTDQVLVNEPSFSSNIATVDANTGALDTDIALPSYNRNIAPVDLTYDSLTADARPMVVAHHTLDPTQSVPTKVSAQLTFNSVADTTYYYDTSAFIAGDIEQIPLEANATSLSTGQYAYTITLGDVRGTTTTSTVSGNVDVLNYSANTIGDGWTVKGLEQITSVTGGVILDLGEGGKSLWFASAGGGSYTTPNGDFSTLSSGGGGYTRTMPDGTVYRFNSSGQQTSVADRNGLRVTYAYSSGNLQTITDPYGKTVTLSYSGGYLQTITDPASRIATFTHSGGSLSGVTLPDSSTWGYSYDSGGRLTQITDPRSKTATIAYDNAERVGTITRPDSTTETLAAEEERGFTTTGTSGSPAPTILLAEARGSHTDPNSHTTDLRSDWWGLGTEGQMTDPDGFVATKDVNSLGLATVSIDRINRVTRATYDSLGNPSTVTYHDGTTLVTSYNTFSEPLVVTNPNGNTTTYTYDGNGNLTVIKDALSDLTTMTYTANGKLQTYKDARGNTTSFAYDSQDRLTTVTYPINSATKLYGYNSQGNVTSVTDERSNQTTYSFDAMNRVTGTTDALTNRTTYQYDASGNLTVIQAPLSRTTTLSYDSLNRVTTITDPLTHNTVLSYDSGGNLRNITDPLSRVTTFSHDDENRRTVVTDPLSHATTTTYDAEGQPVAVTDALTRTTTTTYNSRGWVAIVEDPRTNLFTYTYDNDGDLAIESDAGDGPADPGGGSLLSLAYDVLDRLTTMIDALGDTTTYSYDAVGNLTGITDPNGHSQSAVYDARNRMTTYTDGLAHSTAYHFDDAGNLVSITDPLSHTTSYGYDALNRVTTITDARTAVTTIAYDAARRTVGLTDPNGNHTTWAYDANDNLTTLTIPGGGTNAYVYDNDNELIDQIDADGRRITFAYDSGGRQTNERWLDSSGATVRTITYTYDAANELTGAQDPDATLTFTYDSGGNLLAAGTSGTAGEPLVTLTYSYSNSNDRLSMTDNLSSVGRATYTYDDAHRLVSITQSFGGATGPQVSFGYDSGSRLTSIDRNVGGTTDVWTTFTYDAADRITSITHGAVSGGTNTPLATYSYGYDNADRLTSETNAEGSVTYSYDNTNELTGVSGARAETYVYDSGGNRNMSGYTTTSGNEMTTSPGYTYTYDPAGNLTAETNTSTGAVTTFAYDYRNRLTGDTTRSSGGTITNQETFVYDAVNRRIGFDVSGTQTWSVYDGDNTYADFNGSGTLEERYLYGPAIDEILARTASGGTTAWYLADRLGSVRDIASASGTAIDHIAYDSFGNVLSETSPGSGDRFKFAGMQKGGATQYYDLSRWFDSATGRFDRRDPVSFAAGDPNLYRYVSNAPTLTTDPLGLAGGGFWSDYWYYLTHPGNMDTDLQIIDGTISLITGGMSDDGIGTIIDIGNEGSTVWTNTEGDVYATVGTTAATMTGVRQLDDGIEGVDAVDGHQQTIGENILDVVQGAVQLIGTALGIQQGLSGLWNCFPAGTPVSTTSGLRPIESIEPGHQVWTYDLVSSQWLPCAVLRSFRRKHEGLAVDVMLAGETIRATFRHPFWVVQGDRLEERERREHLASVPEAARTAGRWVDAGDLQAGDRLLLRAGGIESVQSVRICPIDEHVYNFEVDRFHCYAVGRAGALVHNWNGGPETPPARVADITPGKSVKGGAPLTVGEAIDEVAAGGDVYAGSKSTAMKIAEGAGDGAPIWDPPHGPGQKPHYHPGIGGERGPGHVLYD